VSHKPSISSVLNFCLIQLHLLQERKERLRKELLDCKIQEEYLSDVINNLQPSHPTEGQDNE